VDAEAHWNPVLFREPPTGRHPGSVHLWFKAGSTIPGWRTWHQWSGDGGETWSEAAPWLAADTLPRGPVKNKPIVLSDGSWLVGFSDEQPHPEGGSVWEAHVDRSLDGGLSWLPPLSVPIDHAQIAGHGVIQPTLWESQPGRVHMLLRSTCGRVCRSDSTDYGATWSPVVPTGLPHNNSGLDLVRLADGTLALVCNPLEGRARTPLSVLLSHDNGYTWPRRLDLESADDEFSYPAIIATLRGMAITYTARRREIKFWHGSVEQLAG
jgi:predicted neuraminidase